MTLLRFMCFLVLSSCSMQWAWTQEPFGERSICDACVSQSSCDSPFQQHIQQGTFTSLFGIDGSKQPQDFGANANIGIAARLAWSAPLLVDHGIGYQVGSRVTFTGNAVQVFELLGESKDRFQSFTTVGLFKRSESGLNVGVAYDYLSQESFDQFNLGQWRARISFDVTPTIEVGTTVNIADASDRGRFNSTEVQLDPIEQINIFVRQRWKTGTMTAFWLGVADRHTEENVVTVTLPPKHNQLLFGAEIFAPLNDWMAIYGQTNIVMPADTGAVDAFLGVEFSPRGIVRARQRNNRFRPMFSVASNPTFTTDLSRR